jgi:hypothetical protein
MAVKQNIIDLSQYERNKRKARTFVRAFLLWLPELGNEDKNN